MQAGELRDRVHFQRRGVTDDGFGNELPSGSFETQFTAWAKLRPLRGTETVMASRMEGRQPHVMTIRQSLDARQITTAWQAVDARDGNRVFAVTAPPVDPDGKRAFFEILVVEGAVS